VINSDLVEANLHSQVASLRPQLLIDGKWHADYVRLRMKAIKE